jgi:protein ImuA
MSSLIRPQIMALRGAMRTGESPDGDVLPLGIAAVDAALGGGLPCNALHEIVARRESEMAAAAGFVLALTAFQTFPRGGLKSVLWIAEDMALAESGAPHGPGLDAFGITPEKLLTVAAPKTRDVLWVMEEALRCSALGAVIGEIRGGADLVATRRLSLAAGHTKRGILALLLRAASSDEPSAAATRWIVGPVASASSSHGIGPPRFAAHLVRNRRGHSDSWIMEWKSGGFVLAANSEPVAAPALDRPHRAARSAA